MHLLVERSDHLTWLVLMEWWKVGNDFYTVLIWRVHTTYNMGESKKYYICICCISLSSRIYARHCPMHFWPPDWITNVCIEHEVTVKKIYFIFSSLLRPMVYKRVLMALLHSRPEIPQCSTIWLRISNLKRIRLHTFFSTPDAVSSIWRICDKHIRL